MNTTTRSALSLVTVILLALAGLAVGLPVGAQAQPQVASSTVTAQAPQVVLLDTSGSMNETDLGGGTKLDGAKATIADFFRSVPGRSEVGVWTYPGGAGGCAPGGYMRGAELQSVIDPTSLTADVAALRADGDTPTAEALRGVADNLQRAGKKAATIVLVSDGESTCGDPCETAEELVADGFLITVRSVGLNISEAGRKELECIAAATDGSYTDVENSDELFKLMARTKSKQLNVELSIPGSAPSGASVTAVVTAVNKSDQTLTDVRLALTGKASESLSGFFPAVVPPRVSVGNIEPGGTRTYEWTLGLPPVGRPGHMRVKATAVAANALPDWDNSEVWVAGDQLTLDDAGPILTGMRDSPHPVVVMGDSFSSGEGQGPYQEEEDGFAEACHRSINQYAHHMFDRDKVRVLACSGAVSRDLFKPQYPTDPSPGVRPLVDTGQLAKLDEAPAPSGVMLTIGGNDIGFADVIRECAVAVNCALWPAFTTRIHARIAELDLADTYTEVFRTANTRTKLRERDGAIAPVLVLAYPLLYPYVGSRRCGGLSQAELRFGTDLGHRLNRRLQAEVDRAREAGAEVYFVADVEQAFQPDHTMCDTDPYVVPAGVTETVVRTAADSFTPLTGSVQEQAHPTSEGHRAMASRVLQWSTRVTDRAGNWSPDDLSEPAIPDHPKTLGWSERSWETFMLTGIGATVGAVSSAVVEGTAAAWDATSEGREAAVRTMSGPFMVYLHSQPTAMTKGYVGADGEPRFMFEVPPGIEPGRHTLVIDGFDTDGRPLSLQREITLMAAPPRWSPVVIVAIMAMWVAAAVYTVRARRRDRRELRTSDA